MPEGYISGVEIVTRPGCCAERVRDIEVRAGMDPVPNGFKGRLTTNRKVATFDGPADANLKTYRINFDRSILAKYVTLQRIGGGVTLEINEVTMIKTQQIEQGNYYFSLWQCTPTPHSFMEKNMTHCDSNY